MHLMKTADRIIVALDVDSRARAREYVQQLMPEARFFKIGSQLFTACGPDLVREIVELGAQVFLDLKFHDIPETVARSVREAARLRVSLVNVHASGGRSMMQAAVRALKEVDGNDLRPQLIAVTMLTSLGESEAREIGVTSYVKDHSVRLAQLAQQSGLDGVVASPLEIEAIRKTCGRDFLIVAPGIRPAQSQSNDQVRVSTPRAALEAGADYLVIGRPILDAKEPRLAFQEILDGCGERE